MAEPPFDVVLCLMPYASVERPSIALGLLSAGVKRRGISCKVLYPNFALAETLGARLYKFLDVNPNEDLLGEWTFAPAAFPGTGEDVEPYLERAFFSAKAAGRVDMIPTKEFPEFKEMMLGVRERALSNASQAARDALALGPRIVGASSVFQQHMGSLAFLRGVKEADGSVVTVLGGSNCEGPMGAATLRSFPWVDFVVSGEGDQVFPELCERILRGDSSPDPASLPEGVLGRASPPESAASVPRRWPRAVVEDLDSLPSPDYSDYFAALEGSPLREAVSKGLLVETSRGCWWGQRHQCLFCGLNGGGIRYRSKSPERALSEFEELTETYGVRRLQLVDNIFSDAYTATLLPALAERGAPYPLFLESKPNPGREQLRAMADAGVVSFQPGFESLHPEILRLIQKGNTAWGNIQTAKWALEYGMGIRWLFLIRIPGERDEWYAETARLVPLLSHLQPPSGITRLQFNRFSPYTERPEDFGLDLRPGRMYPHVYGLPAREIEDLALYFDDARDLDKTEARAVPVPPGLRACCREITRWIVSWRLRQGPWAQEPPRLVRREVPGGLTVLDTRPCSGTGLHELSGLDAAVLRACEIARTPEGLGRALAVRGGEEAGGAAIRRSLETLQERKLLIQMEGRFLSLPTREPRRFPPPDYVGAEIDLDHDAAGLTTWSPGAGPPGPGGGHG